MRLVLDLHPAGSNALFAHLPLIRALAQEAEAEDQIAVLSPAHVASSDTWHPWIAWVLRDPRIALIAGPLHGPRGQALWRRFHGPPVERYIPSPSLPQPLTAELLRSEGRMRPSGDRYSSTDLGQGSDVRHPGSGRIVCHSIGAPLVPTRDGLRLFEVPHLMEDVRLRYSARRALRSAHRVLTSSRRLAESLLAIADRSEPRLARAVAAKLEVIPRGIDATFCRPLPSGRVEELYGRYPSLEGAYVVAAGAAADPQRDLPLALDAVTSARRRSSEAPRLTIVTGGAPPSALADYVASKGATEHVTLLEPLDAELRIALLRGAQGVLFPASAGEFGGVVLEAATLGVPQLVGPRCGALELLSHNTSATVVVEDGSAESFGRELLEPNARSGLGPAAGREASVGSDSASSPAPGTRTWNDVARDLWALYKRG